MPKRLWIDALTPKQAMFTKAMVTRAPPQFKITVTTRDYSELNQFMHQIKLAHLSFGKHGGGKLLDKLKASIDRENELTAFVSRNDFDFSLSFISPEAARVSFGIGTKHFICSDSPHASAPAKLAVPLASRLFSPFPISKERWMQYGLRESQILCYNALDPWAWLVGKPTLKARPKKRLRKVVIRLEESLASYMQSGMGISASLERLITLIRKSGDFEIILVPRYDEQRTWARKKFGDKTVVPKTTVDGVELLSNADLVIGGGGTMTQEAALLGIPNISYFPSARLDVFENFYFPEKLSIKASKPSELVMQTQKLVQNLERASHQFASCAKKVTSKFEDPVRFVFRNIR